jgi:hypothetical protein
LLPGASSVYRALICHWVYSWRNMKLTTYLHLVVRLKLYGAGLPQSIYTLMLWYLFKEATWSLLFPLLTHLYPLTPAQSSSSNYLTADGHSAHMSWYQVTILDLWPIFLSLHINYIQTLAVFFQCGVPSLKRKWICNLLIQLILGLASSVTLGFKSHSTRDHMLLSQLRFVPFLSPLTTYRTMVEIF